jgi:hypothetical protein
MCVFRPDHGRSYDLHFGCTDYKAQKNRKQTTAYVIVTKQFVLMNVERRHVPSIQPSHALLDAERRRHKFRKRVTPPWLHPPGPGNGTTLPLCSTPTLRRRSSSVVVALEEQRPTRDQARRVWFSLSRSTWGINSRSQATKCAFYALC